MQASLKHVLTFHQARTLANECTNPFLSRAAAEMRPGEDCSSQFWASAAKEKKVPKIQILVKDKKKIQLNRHTTVKFIFIHKIVTQVTQVNSHFSTQRLCPT